jgi:hypothetical protein
MCTHNVQPPFRQLGFREVQFHNSCHVANGDPVQV